MRHSETGWRWGGRWEIKAALLAAVVLTAAGAVFHFAGAGSGPSPVAQAAGQPPAALPSPSSSSLSLPLFFEPNQSQTDARVKFLARGPGYGLFLTSNEAVLSLQQPAVKGQPSTGNIIRMRLDQASPAARIRGTQPLPGKSNYFIGNDPSKWRRGIPQFAAVEYEGVYPGIDLVYYGNQRQLEYDFRVAPGAEPNQIALSFQGASIHLESGDLVLSTAGGDVRFRAPHIYQPASEAMDQPGAGAEQAIAGSFRQLAGNKIGFTVGSYDHSRELVIDPVLTYSTYLGGGGEVCPSAPAPGQGCTQVAVDSANNIYVAGSTTSATFPFPLNPVTGCSTCGGLAGAQNLFIAAINSSATGSAQLLFLTYLGGNGTDNLAGIAVDPGQTSFPSINIYVAGSTTSSNFPTTTNAFQTSAAVAGTHGFLSTVNVALVNSAPAFTLSYSTYLAGSGSDTVTGLAVDSFFDAYVTGTTTSTASTDVLSGFPSTPNAFQICPFQVAQSGGNTCPVTTGPPQFFASQVNTQGSGPQSMLYSTYFGGGYPSSATAVETGGGIAVDVIPNNPRSSVNMYFTGTTNTPGVTGPNFEAPFPLFNALQTCLNQSGLTTGCAAPTTNTDAFLVKLNPNQAGAAPTYSTYLGGSGNDAGIAVAVDTSSNTYVTGSTNSSDWLCAQPCIYAPSPYNAYAGSGGATNAFIAKVGNEDNQLFPLIFFGYIGGAGPDSGQAIVVDAVAAAHVAGTTASSNLPLLDPLSQGSQYGGGPSDAFVALISSTLTTPPTGNYVTYLGGNGLDQGTGIALDAYNSAYVVGATQSTNFPTANPLQASLNGVQNAFVTKIGASSTIVASNAAGSPSPSPVPAGTQATFIFNLTNNGPDPATNVLFLANVPTSGVASVPTAVVTTSGTGSCTSGLEGTILCNVGALAVNAVAQVEVFVTPSIPALNPQIGVSGEASANGGPFGNTASQQVNVTDFTISATTPSPVNAGALATITVTLTPNQKLGYNASISMTETSSPNIVTNPSPTFTITPVVLPGSGSNGSATTVLNIQTVARPVSTGSLFRRTSFYAAWLPIGGLSLVGLGIGAGRKRRRWLAGALFGLLAALILLQPACSSGSSAASTNGGTQAGDYYITILGSTGTGASHNTIVQLLVN